MLNQGSCDLGVWLLRPLAEDDVARAQYGYAMLFRFGCGDLQPDQAQALQWFRRAAANGHPLAQSEAGLSLLYEYHPEITEDEAAGWQEAAVWLQKAAEANVAEAQFFFGDRILRDRAANDPALAAEADRWVRRSADQGYARAEYTLGVMLQDGKPANGEDIREAVTRLRRAAMQDIGSSVQRGAIQYLREIEESRRGPWHSRAEFVMLMQEIADLDDAYAQLYLAEMYEQGKGVPVDLDRAIAWYKKAADGKCSGIDQCESNYVPAVTAMYRMANRYLRGDGVAQSNADALALLRKAATFSHPASQHLLGELYRDGTAGIADRVQAYYWLVLAANNDTHLADDSTRQSAKRESEAIRELLTAAELSEAEKLIAQHK